MDESHVPLRQQALNMPVARTPKSMSRNSQLPATSVLTFPLRNLELCVYDSASPESSSTTASLPCTTSSSVCSTAPRLSLFLIGISILGTRTEYNYNQHHSTRLYPTPEFGPIETATTSPPRSVTRPSSRSRCT